MEEQERRSLRLPSMVRLTSTNMAPKRKTEDIETSHEVVEAIINTRISKLAIDYTNEGINDIARKVNEIIDYLYEE